MPSMRLEPSDKVDGLRTERWPSRVPLPTPGQVDEPPSVSMLTRGQVDSKARRSSTRYGLDYA